MHIIYNFFKLLFFKLNHNEPGLLFQWILQNRTNKITLTLSLVCYPFYLTFLTSLLFYLLFPSYYFAFLLYMLLNTMNAISKFNLSIGENNGLLDMIISSLLIWLCSEWCWLLVRHSTGMRWHKCLLLCICWMLMWL